MWMEQQDRSLEGFLAAGVSARRPLWRVGGVREEHGWRSRSLWGHTERQFGAAFAPLETGNKVQRQLLATASEDLSARIWDVGSGECIRCLDRAHNDEVLRVAWAGDGGMLATGGADGTVKLWASSKNWPCVATLDHGAGKQIYALRYMPHAEGTNQLLTASEDTILKWDLGTTAVAQAWQFPNLGLSTAHGGLNRNPDQTIDVFDVAISAPDIASSGPSLLAAALGDGSVRVVDPRCPSVVAVLLSQGDMMTTGAPAPAVTGVDFSPSASELVRHVRSYLLHLSRW